MTITFIAGCKYTSAEGESSNPFALFCGRALGANPDKSL
jgi:hypothetical protein